MSFKRLGKGNPCPICGSESGACRQHSNDENYIHCHTHADAKKFEVINGWKCIEVAKAHTAGFKPDTKISASEAKKNYNSAKKSRHQQRQLGFKKLLPISERNTAYRTITAKLELSLKHKNHLKEQRGLTETEIDFAYQLGWIRTWQPGIKVKVDGLVAGVSPSNKKLVGGHGIAIAATDASNQITGFQIASDDREKFAKYFWLSSAKHGGSSPNLQNGELPLFVWKHPQADKINEVWLVEGALKSLITALNLWFKNNRTDVMVIGAAGGNMKGSENALKDALASSNNCKNIKLQPDAGAVSNPHITSNYRKILNSLVSDGYECTVGWWGQSTKFFSDIDELEPCDYSNITYLSLKKFKALCVKWGGIKNNPVEEVLQLDYQARVAFEQKKLHSLTKAADLTCDSTQKYLPDLVGKIPTSGIVLLKSPKGSGKSTQIKKIKQHCCGYTEEIIIQPKAEPEQLSLLGKNKKSKLPKQVIEEIRHKGLGMNFISINARIALGRGQAVQWEFTWIEDADIDGKGEFGTKVCTATVIENISEIGCCWDSLGKFFERDWSNTLVVIDEIELGLNHLSTSSTCKDRRSFILNTLEVKLKECLENKGLVIAADADLTDVSYDYLKAITGHTPYVVEHDFKGDPWEIDFYTGKRDLLLTQIEEWVSNENCEPIAIAMDNQKECEALANHLIKKFPYLKNHFGGLIRIDSRITQTDFGKDFVKHTVKKIEEYKPKILLFTPSLGVGCDIHIKYFKHVFGLFYGNLEPSQARQMLARVRESVPRSVWCKARANSSQDTPTSYIPSEIKKRLFSNKDSNIATELAWQRAKKKAPNNCEDKEFIRLYIEELESMTGDEGWDNTHVDLYCKQIARRNYSLSQLAVQLRQELIDEGHNLTDVAIDEGTITGDSVRYEKDEIKRQKSKATANAEDIEVDEAVRIKSKPARTEEENHKATKALLKRELPGVELTPDFIYKVIYKDDRRRLNQIRLFWMAINPDITKELDSQEWRKKLKQFSNGVAYLPDVKTDSHKVEVIQKTGLLNFLNPLEEFTKDSPKIQQFIKDCHRHRKKLKSAFGIHLTKNYPAIKLLNRLLERIGLKMGMCRKVKKGSKERYYKLKSEELYDKHRLAVIESLNQKFKNEPSNCTQTQSQQAPQGRHKLDISLYNNQTSASQIKPENEVLQDVVSSDKNAADFLRGVSDWGEITLSQQQINEAWKLLSEPEQARLRSLHAEYEQRREPQENYESKYSQLENAIASQTEVKEVGFGSHFRSYQILKILDDGIAWVKRLFGDKGEFEIPISKLVF
ncbi:MAG: plasmid replication protein, CyRepA1 family [Cyanobacteria bacterium P01_C01_bin.38]